ncbi:hypothetical protein [Paenibacillus tengchongensis]|uniref:hypothetical protein n=1 Tax=Paenibacillus tengchongensis TaxID=2608684 RepID=UPI00124D751E|nr:hypothetical protein [Paenibacillus tengchongensis]
MRRLLFRLPILLLLLLASCGPADDNLARPGMPERMPDDFAFSVRFGITGRNEIDTFAGTVTKDLVSSGTATVNLTLNEDELLEIYNRMRELQVMGDLKLETTTLGCAQIPYEEEHWRIRVDGAEVLWSWSEERCRVTEDAARLKALREYVDGLIKAKTEYAKLPEASGGYD